MVHMWKELLFHENLLQFLALCMCTILVAYLLTEIIAFNANVKSVCPATCQPIFGYTADNGPHTWKDKFADCHGKRQSPVCILTRQAVLKKDALPLVWSHYNRAPLQMTLFNNGCTVMLQGWWSEPTLWPTLRGGPVETPYCFQAALFRWGLSDVEGSEHILDYMGFPLELQAMHVPASAPALSGPTTLCVSYLFEITEMDNPYLDQVVLSLPRVAMPGRAVDVTPFPLMWLCPPFRENYFCYDGSLTFPPCSENVQWIVRPTTIGISTRQVAAFRQLTGWDGPLRSNLRPVQPLHCRPIFFFKTSEEGKEEPDS